MRGNKLVLVFFLLSLLYDDSVVAKFSVAVLSHNSRGVTRESYSEKVFCWSGI